MAMSNLDVRVQDIHKCELCESDHHLQYKCLDCNLFMCLTCRKKVHCKIKDAYRHKIVEIKELGRTDFSAELNFRNMPCTLHPEQFYCLYCTTCEKLICPTCIAKGHAGHNLLEIKDIYAMLLNKLSDAVSELETQEKELDTKEMEFRKFKEHEIQIYFKLQNEMEAQRQTYKNNIDEHFNQLAAVVKDKTDKIERTAINVSTNISKTRTDIAERKNKTKTLQDTRDACEFFASTFSVLTDAKVKIPVTISKHPETLLKFVPKHKHLTGELLGALEDKPRHQKQNKNLELRVKKEYTTKLNHCHFITACSDGSFVIAQCRCSAGQGAIDKIHIKKHIIKTIFTKKIPIIADIDTLHTSHNLLLVDRTPILKIIDGSTGDIRESQYRTGSLLIIALHVTMDNKVVVGARSPGDPFPVNGRRVVIVMDSDGKHQVEWENNQRGERLFCYPRPAASTKNGNIFVRDRLSSDGKGHIITLNPTGDVLSTYTGHQDINNEQTPFTPFAMTRTPSDNVIVCDFYTHALHLLNKDGDPLSYIFTSTIGIMNPHCVRFDNEDRLYVGCTAPSNSTKKAKLYQVNYAEVE